MVRTLVLVVVVPTTVVLAVVFGAAMHVGAPAGPVYTPGQVKAGVSTSPHGWAGRRVWVRGTLIGLSTIGLAASPYYVLQGTAASSHLARAAGSPAAHDAYLLLLPPTEAPLLSVLRHLPLVRWFVPTPRPPTRLVSAVYRLSVFAPGQACTWMDAERVCYDAALMSFSP